LARPNLFALQVPQDKNIVEISSDPRGRACDLARHEISPRRVTHGCKNTMANKQSVRLSLPELRDCRIDIGANALTGTRSPAIVAADFSWFGAEADDPASEQISALRN